MKQNGFDSFQKQKSICCNRMEGAPDVLVFMLHRLFGRLICF